jgi:hypothetical protein
MQTQRNGKIAFQTENVKRERMFRLINTTAHTPGVCYGKKGCGYIKKKIQGLTCQRDKFVT